MMSSFINFNSHDLYFSFVVNAREETWLDTQKVERKHIMFQVR